MPSSTIACCNAARRITSLSTQSSALWITDDHLNHAFNRWAQATQHSSKRRGSSVPGPLEARKRASGRRHSASAYIERSPVESAFGWPFWGSSAVPPNVGWKYEPPWPTSNVLESIGILVLQYPTGIFLVLTIRQKRRSFPQLSPLRMLEMVPMLSSMKRLLKSLALLNFDCSSYMEAPQSVILKN